MQRETFPVAPLGCNCSILYEETTRDAVVVDPGSDVVRVMGFLAEHGLKLSQIVITHGHLDHIAGAKLLSEQTSAPVVFHTADLFQLGWMEQQAAWMGVPVPRTGPPDIEAVEGLKICVGESTGSILHTPGHTEGSICIYFPDSSLLLAGDTLFREGIGRTDLPGGDGKRILQSIREKLLPLPDNTVVIAGHGSQTSIGHEAEMNPFIVK